MRTAVFIIVLIIVVFMAGTLIINIVYRKHVEKQKATRTHSTFNTTAPAIYAAGAFGRQDPETPEASFKPIVMDLGFTHNNPF